MAVRGAERLFRSGKLPGEQEEPYWDENIRLIKEALEPDLRELRRGQAELVEGIAELNGSLVQLKASNADLMQFVATELAEVKSSLAAIREKLGI